MREGIPVYQMMKITTAIEEVYKLLGGTEKLTAGADSLNAIIKDNFKIVVIDFEKNELRIG